MTNAQHIPVLLDDVVDVLAPRDGAVYVDATFGAGGYSRALLDAADCTVWGIDRDPNAAKTGNEMAAEFAGRLTVLNGRFGEMKDLLTDVGVAQVDGIALDLGVSSMQIDDPMRGFSFRADGPLDMRMGQETEGGLSAADAVNQLAEKELADIIYIYGEERASRKIARAIVELREQSPITRTGQLAEIVRSVVRRSKDGIDPATRTFQALRIYVNEELAELDRGLTQAATLLGKGGRLAVVSFHSLEDRRVKTFLQRLSGAGPRPSRHVPLNDTDVAPNVFEVPERQGRKPAKAEITANPRARSARLRWAERTAAPMPEAA